MPRQRYSCNPATTKPPILLSFYPAVNSTFDFDIRQIQSKGFDGFANAVIDAELSEAFWKDLLPQYLDTSSTNSPYFRLVLAAQVKMHDHGSLSRDITVRDLILNRSDVHHVFSRNFLKKQGLQRGKYNQIANYVLAQNEINISIGDKAPAIYFQHLVDQCNGGKKHYGAIAAIEQLRANLKQHAIPEEVLNGHAADYDEFLVTRRRLMAGKLRQYFHTL